ncbi:uncharacterized protein LOC106465143 [Limulus polyphemus]|uniref:Uncharacterized protein LOC106465143 n=1 Tax=Limulus polyphemus TaxID=6850 RepID=A0ABM1SYG9_LIMPO|nr:uncharacterized protein LOC106465143 [Limulus polyphemus]
MKMKIAVILACSIAVAVSAPSIRLMLTTGNANRYIDELISNFRKNKDYVSKIDPFRIPLVMENPNLRVYNMVVRGLSNLKRSGDVTLEVTNNTGIMELDGSISITGIIFSGSYWAKKWIFKISGQIYGQLSEVAIKLILNAELSTGQISLKYLKVNRFSNFMITKVTGLTFLFNWILRIIVNYTAQRMKGKIIQNIEINLKNNLREILNKIKFPSN